VSRLVPLRIEFIFFTDATNQLPCLFFLLSRRQRFSIKTGSNYIDWNFSTLSQIVGFTVLFAANCGNTMAIATNAAEIPPDPLYTPAHAG